MVHDGGSVQSDKVQMVGIVLHFLSTTARCFIAVICTAAAVGHQPLPLLLHSRQWIVSRFCCVSYSVPAPMSEK
jgi:hypothetical protein